MLKIRMFGTEAELRRVAHKVGSSSIKRIQRKNGEFTFAIDAEISVQDFLFNMGLSENNQENCDAQQLQAELEDLLDEIGE